MTHRPSLQEIRSFNGKYPVQLWLLSAVEMWERFCFYGMRGILTLFMVDQLQLTDQEANLRYGAIQAFVYAFTFAGGILADKVLGFRRSLVFGMLVMISGNLLIALAPATYFYPGISLSIIGTGFFKPNISSMVGQLYHERDERRDAGYSLFYAAVNVGALLGGSVCVYLGKYVGWNYAFLAASLVMVIGMLTYQLTKHRLGPVGTAALQVATQARRPWAKWVVYAGALAVIPLILLMVQNTEYTAYFMYTVGPLALLYFVYEWIRLKEAAARWSLLAALVFILAYIFYIAFFEQMGGSLSLFAANHLTHDLLFFRIDPNVVNNSSGAFFVIVFSFPLGMFWIWLAGRKMEPHTVVKFGFSFLLLALGFFIFYATRFFADANGMTSLNVFTLAYVFIEFSELCIGPIGLSVISKLSPGHLTGMMMGLWFLASAYGQYVAGVLGAGMSVSTPGAGRMEKLIAYTDGYKQVALYAVGIAVVLLLVYPLIKKMMGSTR